ncbi:MAG TPA: hypothetical protein VMU83_06310 [Hanamia sp.]|nr:hypothetical protein [Hanamia sp.]
MKHFKHLIIACTIFISCTKNSIFVADNANSQLPEYSESGRNIAGALFNDTTWRSNVYIDRLSGTYMSGFWIISSLSGDSTTIIFNGKHSYNSINFVGTLPAIPVNFFVVIKGLKIENQDSLFKLNGKTFNLDGNNNYVALTYSYNDFSFLKNRESFGSIIFNKVQKNSSFTIGDGSPNNPIINPFIVSGHFNFTINGTSNYNINDGRFDMVAQWETNLVIAQ